ncbi:MAG TPA: hypothetical protein VL547_08700 [Dinghuibacter sp.]|jgi:hypothetical protein|uniref:hypothetical protein n=1 Tax=Dinghuibacter sp. TaxID=2024697 RepID=UPI002B90480F|nr:hypothetical protein [Dinghuibacter sp.]HTJ12091.1 hypothetical protein [Dinghuibacter sp.]
MKRLALLCLSLWLVHRTCAQSDSSAFAGAISQFHKILSPENGLYNGSEYVDYAASLKNGHPYFGSAQPFPGRVTYDGMTYDNLTLWYDVVRDGLVTVPPNMGFKMVLNSPRVKSFYLDGRKFIRLVRDSTHDIRTGFYEVLYEGRVRLLRRTSKNIQESVTTTGVEHYIYADSSYHLEKGGHYYSINKKKSVLEALSDKRKEVQAYIRRNKLSLKRGKDESLTQIITYYDGLPYADASR